MNPKIVQTRVLFFRVVIVLTFAVLSVQLWRLQIVEGEQYRLRANDNRLSILSLDAPRGVVYDRRGTVLVRNRPGYSVKLVPADVPEDELQRESMFALLASLLDIPVSVDAEAEKRNRDDKGTLPLVFPPPPERPQEGIRQIYEEGLLVPYRPLTLKTSVDQETASLIQEMLVRLPGVQVSIEPVRQYLHGPTTTHVLGYVGRIPEEGLQEYESQGYNPNDRVGLTGVEASYENQLRGQKGQKTVEVDVAGREIRAIGPRIEAVPGHNLILTIDVELQRVMETALRKGMDAARASSAVAVAMNPKTGEILGMVSLPSYDGNLFSTGISVEDYLRLSLDKSRPLVNHAVGGQYPPGSIFKVIPAAAALEEGAIDPNHQFICKGTMWVPNRYFPDDPEMAQPFYCWNRDGHGLVNLNVGLAESCDIYFYQLGGGYGGFEGLGLDLLAQYAREFGLGERTGIDLPGESRGLIPSAKWKRLTYSETWVTGDTYNMTIGQGFVLATPIQMLNATAAIANGGTLYRPQLLREIVDVDDNVLRPFQPEVIRQVPVSQESLELTRQGMLATVQWGTAKDMNLPQVVVAGKTGTAEFPGPRDHKGRLPTHAWFTAFAPYDDPQIALIVFVGGGGEGSLVAVPIAREILEYYFATPQEKPPDTSALLIPPTLAMITATTPVTVPAGPTPGVLTAPTAPAPVAHSTEPATSFAGTLVKVEQIETDIGVLEGRVVDRDGRGLAGVQVTINGGGAPVFEPTTGPNGEFRYDLLNAYASPRWNVRVLGVPNSEELHLEVQPFRKYTVEFRQS